MDEKRVSIADHPSLQIRWQEPVIGVITGAEAIAFFFCALVGHWPALINGAYGLADRFLWALMAIVFVSISYSSLRSNGRTRRLRERLGAQEVGR